MNEKMKKINFFFFFREKKKMLYHLQKLGLFHIEISDAADSQRYERMFRLRERFIKVQAVLKQLNKNSSAENSAIPSDFSNIRERLQFIEDLLSIKESQENALLELEQNRLFLLPWGIFSWSSLDSLRSAGVRVRFYIGSQKVLDQFDFKDIAVFPVKKEGGHVYFIVFEYGSPLPVLPFEEIRMPGISLSDIENDIEMIRENIRESERELLSYFASLNELEKEIHSLESGMSFEKAKESLIPHESETIFQASGYFPSRKLSFVTNYLKNNDISYAITDPSSDENVPILLHNSLFSRIFEPITKIFSLPDYYELDPTPFFAPFFAVFFGLCLGDLGYGLILFTISLFLIFFGKENYKIFAVPGTVLGLAAAAGGLFTNTFFGEAVFSVPGSSPGLLKSGGEIAFLSTYTVNGKTVFPILPFSLVLGYVQITFGIILQAINALRLSGKKAVLMPLGSLFMIFGGTITAIHHDILGLGFNPEFKAGPIPFGTFIAFFPPLAGETLGILGLILFFFFNNTGLNFFIRPLTGLWEFYGFVTGLLGDLLSYIRLFALGLASGLLGNSFNHIAFMVLPAGENGPDYHSFWMILTVMILIAGHTLNLGLSLLGSFVHPLRLTFVEFYKNIKFKGGGRSYLPFALHK